MSYGKKEYHYNKPIDELIWGIAKAIQEYYVFNKFKEPFFSVKYKEKVSLFFPHNIYRYIKNDAEKVYGCNYDKKTRSIKYCGILFKIRSQNVVMNIREHIIAALINR